MTRAAWAAKVDRLDDGARDAGAGHVAAAGLTGPCRDFAKMLQKDLPADVGGGVYPQQASAHLPEGPLPRVLP